APFPPRRSSAPPFAPAIGLTSAAARVLAWAIRRDRRSVAPLTPSGAFWSNTALGPGFWVVLLMPVAGAVTAVYLVMLLQQLWGYGPTLAGAVGAIMAIGWSFSSVTVANVRKRSTRKVLIRTGPVLLALGLFGVFMGLQLHLPPLLMVAQALIGMGFGISNGY